MNKKILIAIVAFLIAGASLFLIFQKPEPSQFQAGRCGDGICDSHEQTNLKSCPRDCKNFQQAETCGENNKGYCVDFKEKCKSGYEGIGPDKCKAGRSAGCCVPTGVTDNNINNTDKDNVSAVNTYNNESSEISPFGIMAAFSPSTLANINAADKVAWAGEKFRDLGAKWSRGAGETVIWAQIEPKLNEGYSWSNSDKVLKKAYEVAGENFNMVVTISPARFKGDNPDIPPEDESYYSKAIEELVERYDGDGINDYDSIIKVKYWQMENEPFPSQWKNRGGTFDGYVRFAELTHGAIKKSDPTAKIILGTFDLFGDGLADFQEVIPKMKDKNIAFDYADTHFWSAKNSYNNYKIPVGEARNVLNSNGYSNSKMVALEFGSTVTLNGTTEKDQANYLIKGYIYNIAHGFSLINWNNLVEWANFGRTGGMFNYMGLIADGENGDIIPAGTQRLSYYTYKKMTETLEGSDWDNIQSIQESSGVYIYKFNKLGKPIWVAWNDNATLQTIVLDVGNINSVKITEAIPKSESGKDVTAYSTAFNTGTKSVNNNQITLTLSDKPVFIEE